MKRTTSIWLYALAAVLVSGIAAGGCAKPKPAVPPTQFIGTWISAPPGTKVLKTGTWPTLTFAADGTGIYTMYPDPHSTEVSWVVRRGKLVMTNRDGSGSNTYSYRFEGSDKLILVMEGGEVSFTRYKAPAPEGTPKETEQPPAKPAAK